MTYFNAVYMHHTPFVTETIEIPFDTPVEYGKSITSTIPPRGDVITSIKLKTVHAALYTTLTSTYCWPVWPADIPVQPIVYLLISGSFTAAVQPVPTNVYYGTNNLFVWANNLYPATVTLTVGTANAFVFTGTTTIYFASQSAAVFYGMNPRLPDVRLRGYYGYTITGSRTADLTFFQSGWVQGLVPPTSSSYYDGVGTRCIDRARLILGGQTQSEITGRSIDLKNDTDVIYGNQSGLTVTIGKNDTSQQLIPRVCYTDLEFGIDQLPICAMEKQDAQVRVDFAPSSNITTVTQGAGSIFASNSYTTVDFRNLFSANTWNTVDVSVYNNILGFRESFTNTRYSLDITKQLNSQSSFTNLGTSTVSTAPAYFPANLSFVNSNIYDINDRYTIAVRRTVVSDYYKNINNVTYASYILWDGGAYGYPLQTGEKPSNSDGSTGWGGTVTYGIVSGKYLYIEALINYNYLATSGIPIAWYSSSYTSPSLVLTHLFMGVTSPSAAALLEWVNWVKARDTAITANTVPSVIVSGSNCRVTATFTTTTGFTPYPPYGSEVSVQYFGLNKMLIRYDTTMDMNSPAAYSHYWDINRITNYALTGGSSQGLGYGWGDPTLNESINFQGDGRYLYKRYKNYILQVDTLNFLNANGYSLYNWTSISPTPFLGAQGSGNNKIIFDGKYGYFSMTAPGAPYDYNFSRFRIGSDLSNPANWEGFYSRTSIPWQTIAQNLSWGSSPWAFVSGFDGRYVYYVGASGGSGPHILVYDTTLPFQASSFGWISKNWSTTRGYGQYPGQVATDANNIYLMGWIYEDTHVIKNLDGTTYRTLTGIDLGAGRGQSYIAKYAKSTGLCQWVVRCNGSGSIPWERVRVDSAGNVYFVARAEWANQTYISSNDANFTPVYGPVNSFGEGVLAKINSSGIFQWVVQTGTIQQDGGRSGRVSSINDVAIDDATGDVYMVGIMNGPGGQSYSGPAYCNLYSAGSTTVFKSFVPVGGGDCVVAKLNSSGVYQWASNVSPTWSGATIAYSSTNGVIVTGYYTNTTISIYNSSGTLYGTLPAGNSGASDVYVVKYSASTGTVTGSLKLTSAAANQSYVPSSCALDSSGAYAYIASTYTGGSGTILSNVLLSSMTNTWNATLYGSDPLATTSVSQNPIVAFNSGNIYVTCPYSANNFTVTHSNGATFKTFTNTPSPYYGRYFYDTLLVKYSGSGTALWASDIKGERDEFPIGLVAENSKVYLYMSYMSSRVQIDQNFPFYFTSDPVGDRSGGRLQSLHEYNTDGVWTKLTLSDNIGFSDRFRTSLGPDLTGLDPVGQGGWNMVQGLRYFYLYRSDTYFNVLNPNMWQFDPSVLSPSLKASVLVDYAHLMKDEVEWFKKTTQDYTIELVQRMSVPITLSETYIPLRFDGPVRELVMTLMTTANQNTYTYSNLSSVALYFNNEQLLDYDSTLYQFIEPWETKNNFPTRNMFIHSFGSPVNFSRLASKVLRVNTTTSGTLDIYAKVYNILRFKDGLVGSVFNSYTGVG